MIHFGNDYHRSAHPRVLEAIAEADGAYAGYGADELCATAAERIRTACQAPNAEVHFMVGGTQANATIIAHRLRPWEGVIAADSGHIATHETGAIEHTGHKVITLPNQLGKITAAQVRACMEEYRASGVEEHMPEPALVYITQPTEFGTAYSRAELVALREVCDEYELGLFVDGARLGYGLSASDITLPDLAALVDVFTIGGTKCGALFGEAIVFPAGAPRFRNAMKQNGGLLAKGWLLGAQFASLFSAPAPESADALPGTAATTLYEQICARANAQAQRIAEAFRTTGIDMLFDSPTNQQFALLTREQEEKLSQDFVCQFFEEHEGLRVVRFCTAWSTEEGDVDKLCAAISALK
ncbi:beta-eliminating lyase-related protein [Corynebacterium sp. B5-R-101]|uniref:Beta-eliminating lyase-related protein n=1 Tax=Corynebacterium intestinale TaxID=2943492 RepID=A0ABT0TBH7_9CORY|nr:aminotransferase class I/II-fold pyridoxal phosphate-dependent enzyme [Corynebacterium intestinale]MCL8494441.1 beta-eliminating lyase-related protein [Corynebacterium intestinale]MCP1390677.1 beta-eliminating lyase-related protein [Corynebacterium intestinale]